MNNNRRFSIGDATPTGTQLKINWSQIDLEQFRRGLGIELGHGVIDPQPPVTGDDPLLTGKFAWAHLKEIIDYYDRLDRLEVEAEGKV